MSVTNEKKKLSDAARINRAVILCHAGIDVILTLAYLIEVFKGSRTILYFLCIAALGLLPVAVDGLIYKKNKESASLKYFIAICYLIYYGVLMFTSDSILPFTYIMPVMMVILLYSEPKFCLLVGVAGNVINILNVAYIAMTAGYTKDEIPDIEIRIILIILVSFYEVLSTGVLKQMNVSKQQALQAEKEKAEKLLQEVMRLSGELSAGIEQIDRNMKTLDNSTDEMGNAMEEVNSGTLETAESIQKQMVRTEEIQKLIDDVREVSEHIMEGMETASAEVNSGLANMKELAVQSEKSKEANATVVRLMEELQNQAEKMNQIITMITSVANRTGMLALNASIEAARAGDAGRGFTVVANQVTDLSEQTKQAAVNITDLIQTVVDELMQVTEAVAVLEENAAAQDAKSMELGRSLQTITDLTNSITEKTQGMEKMITNLAEANGDIVRNIQTISAVTEEVTAHSGETMNTCRENRNVVNEVSMIAAKLNTNAQDLRNAQEQVQSES